MPALLVSLLCLAPWLPPQEPSASTPEAPDAALEAPISHQPPPHGYRPPEALAEALKAQAQQSNRFKLIEIGHSPEGRPLLVASFAGPSGPAGPLAGSPEILVVANLEGNRLGASELAMQMVAHLAKGDSPLLATASVHLLPVANPDAMAHALAGEGAWRGRPVDEDHDGRLDEDGPQDLDGDGRLTWVRIPDAVGRWLADADDPRATREADATKGERGRFRFHREGTDQDGDREELEDGPGGVRLEANFPHRWQQYEPAAGRFQLSEPESRAVVDFMLLHPAIALVIVLDDEDNLAKPPAGGDKAGSQATQPLKADATLLKRWSERLYAEAETPRPRSAEDQQGNFADWAYFQFGAQVIESALWSPPLDVAAADGEALPKEADDSRKLLAWADAWYPDGGAFQPWHEVLLPQLGTVEVGGWLPLVRENPPADLLPELGQGWNDFLDSLAADFAHLAWREVQVETRGDRGVVEVRAELVNEGGMPSRSAMADLNRHALPIRIYLELPAGGELLVGERITSVGSLAGQGGHQAFHWIYRLPDGAEPARLRARSTTAGEAMTTLETQR